MNQEIRKIIEENKCDLSGFGYWISDCIDYYDSEECPHTCYFAIKKDMEIMWGVYEKNGRK